MPQVSRDLLVDLWYPGEIRPEPAEPASADGLLYMFLHRDAEENRRGRGEGREGEGYVRQKYRSQCGETRGGQSGEVMLGSTFIFYLFIF